MKIAYCYTGKIKRQINSNTSIDLNIENLPHNRLILKKKHQKDVYCHSWNPEHATEIDSILKPIRSLHEDPIDFKLKPLKPQRICEDINKKCPQYCIDFIRHSHLESDYKYQVVTRNKSSAYSIKQCVSLVNEYYDVVVICRYDASITKTIYLDDLDISNTVFCANTTYPRPIKMKQHIITRVHMHPEFLLSNLENIRKYATLYEQFDDYRCLYRNYSNLKKHENKFMDHYYKSYHIMYTLKLNLQQLPEFDFEKHYRTLR